MARTARAFNMFLASGPFVESGNATCTNTHLSSSVQTRPRSGKYPAIWRHLTLFGLVALQGPRAKSVPAQVAVHPQRRAELFSAYAPVTCHRFLLQTTTLHTP
eukprot:3028116-Rhodomonas_salina.1